MASSTDLIQSRAPSIHLATQDVTPPNAFYVDSNDQVNVWLWSSIAGVQINLDVRFMGPEGLIVPFQFSAVTNATRAVQVNFWPLQEGFIISVAAYAATGTMKVGQVFARVFLLRGYPGTVISPCEFFSGYLTGTDIASAPQSSIASATAGRGYIRSVTGTLPGAGAEITETVPTNALWRLISFRFNLTTAVAVANRAPHLVLDDSANIFSNNAPINTQAASLTYGYQFGADQTPMLWPDNGMQQGVADSVLLQPGWRIRTLTTNLQAADQYTAPQYLVEEWIYS